MNIPNSIAATNISSLHLSSPNPHHVSIPKSTITSLPFNTHLTKGCFSIKSPSQSHRLTPIAAAATSTANTYTLCPAAPETETFYELLGISESGTLSEIKAAYKQMALKYHPDVSPPDRAEEYTRKFIRVQEAYETLSDPETRALYDMDMDMAKGLHLAFSGRREVRFDDKSGWKDRWESQIVELKRRSDITSSKVDSRGRMSWAARIRNRQDESEQE